MVSLFSSSGAVQLSKIRGWGHGTAGPPVFLQYSAHLVCRKFELVSSGFPGLLSAVFFAIAGCTASVNVELSRLEGRESRPLDLPDSLDLGRLSWLRLAMGTPRSSVELLHDVEGFSQNMVSSFRTVLR